MNVIWAKGNDDKYYRIDEGTGDNLLQEDIDAGYVDYIYYDIYETLEDAHLDENFDGGMYLLKKYYVDMTLEEIVKCIEDEEGVTLQVLES